MFLTAQLFSSVPPTSVKTPPGRGLLAALQELEDGQRGLGMH